MSANGEEENMNLPSSHSLTRTPDCATAGTRLLEEHLVPVGGDSQPDEAMPYPLMGLNGAPWDLEAAQHAFDAPPDRANEELEMDGQEESEGNWEQPGE